MEKIEDAEQQQGSLMRRAGFDCETHYEEFGDAFKKCWRSMRARSKLTSRFVLGNDGDRSCRHRRHVSDNERSGDVAAQPDETSTGKVVPVSSNGFAAENAFTREGAKHDANCHAGGSTSKQRATQRQKEKQSCWKPVRIASPDHELVEL